MAAASISAKKTLDPQAEEFKPTAIEKNLVPSLPHQIFHPQGNELVVYQPPPQGNELVVYQPPPQYFQSSYFSHPHQFYYYYYYQENDGPVKAPIYWIHREDFQPQQQQLLDQYEIIPHQDQSSLDIVGMKKKWMRAEKAPDKDGIFRREPFMLFVDHYCSKNHWEYDFLYLPIDFWTNNNMGYAFVNFTSGRAAFEIREVLKNFKWRGVKTPTGIYASGKICEVTWARIQGKEQLVRHFSGSNFLCDTDDFLPVVFSPARNGSSSLTKPMTIGKLAASPAVSSPPSPDDE
ncbi:hypothetical protein RND71_025746 [Anisodus tanguticus]|uniref:Mei2-like C-terminal RNA recognition motif domain-containing protein n=1 Tax=Anisodus tanguticus TaxID=243964 RepID=A0AAE1RML9_9SOLA|nr:hypothetical protein RND71_025746 [Anisodus tanguticus]